MAIDDFNELIIRFLRIWASFEPFKEFKSGWRIFAEQIPNYSLDRINS